MRNFAYGGLVLQIVAKVKNTLKSIKQQKIVTMIWELIITHLASQTYV